MSAGRIVRNDGARQKDGIVTRVAQIEVYPQYLEEYLRAAYEVAETSVRNEKGVLFLYPMQVEREKNKILILGGCRDQAAYQVHIQTPHFLKYKSGTLQMVKSLELIDAHPLLPKFFLGESKKLPAVENGTGVKKIITIEEYFTLPAIRAKVMKYLTEQNRGVPPVSEAQRELMKIVLPTNDDIDEVGERRFRFMDGADVDMQVLSYGAGSPQNITDTALAIA